ncbi:unnamed protein product [Protopolystoma xenopodis]|uniref:Uncharacterized protein n=1 Tax=Protopolystoma xenopodis TaxID=117903 RepID=A0A448XG29_9PLAT|nr:unnamed protein product [Protopolystoma xenopodis]
MSRFCKTFRPNPADCIAAVGVIGRQIRRPAVTFRSSIGLGRGDRDGGYSHRIGIFKMARGAGGLLDGGFVFKLGRLFKTPYGGEGVDFVDQLNYQFTGGLMVIFIAIVSLRQYVGFVLAPPPPPPPTIITITVFVVVIIDMVATAANCHEYACGIGGNFVIIVLLATSPAAKSADCNRKVNAGVLAKRQVRD